MSRLDDLMDVDEGFNFKYLAVIYKTEKLNKAIEYITKKLKPFWRIYFSFGAPFSFAMMMYGLFSVGLMISDKIGGSPSDGGGGSVEVIIPGVTTPLIAGIVSILIVMVVHEFSHGIAARLGDIPVKSTGLFIFLILPGAYVEPDERYMENSSYFDRMRVFGAGSYSNIVLGFTLALIYSFYRDFIFGSMFFDIYRWTVILNLGIGVMNLFPIYPLDGGHMIKDIFDRLLDNDKLSKLATGLVSVLGMSLIALGLIMG